MCTAPLGGPLRQEANAPSAWQYVDAVHAISEGLFCWIRRAPAASQEAYHLWARRRRAKGRPRSPTSEVTTMLVLTACRAIDIELKHDFLDSDASGLFHDEGVMPRHEEQTAVRPGLSD